MNEVKKVNNQREKELEDRIYEFNKMKDQIYEKAKKDSIKDQKKKLDKYQSKLERVK